MQPIEIRFGGYQGPASVHTRAGHVFGKELDMALGGAVRFEFESNIVDRGRKAADLFTMVESGELTGCYFSSSYLAERVPELGIFDQHFLLPDRATARRLLQGPLGERLRDLVARKTGYIVLDFWDNGVRHISNGRRRLRTPEDCQGLKLRTLDNEAHRRAFRALGFQPMTIDVRDLPAAVADGTVDAQENPLTNTYHFGLHATHRHITLTQHLMGVALVLFNKQQVNAWPADFRAHVQRALHVATVAQHYYAEDDDEICAEKLTNEGAEITALTEAERAAFVQACQGELDGARARFDPELLALFDAGVR